MENDLISRKALLNDIGKINYIDYGSMFDFYAHATAKNVLGDISKIVTEAPAIAAEPVRHGRWAKEDYLLGWTYRCSRCKQNYGMPHGMFSYCPNCGARMDAKED